MKQFTYENVLVTGAAGFIGFHLANRLIAEGYSVTGIDNLSPYYDINLKRSRLDILNKSENFIFKRLDLARAEPLEKLFDSAQFDVVVNLAAQAGVRYSLKNPQAYVDANLVGFVNVLECCRHSQVRRVDDVDGLHAGQRGFPRSGIVPVERDLTGA